LLNKIKKYKMNCIKAKEFNFKGKRGKNNKIKLLLKFKKKKNKNFSIEFINNNVKNNKSKEKNK
jgi:hypothetical protein